MRRALRLRDLVEANYYPSIEAARKAAQRGTLPGAFRLGSQWRVDETTFLSACGLPTDERQPIHNGRLS